MNAAPMSAEEVILCLDQEAAFLRGFKKLSEYCDDPEPWLLAGDRLFNARTAVAAMAEREAALVAERDALRKMWTQAESDIAALVKEVEALRAWRTLETPMLDILLMEGDDPVVIAAHGKIAGVIESVVDDLKQNPLPEFEQHGDGVYTVRAHYFSGQYGEYGRCEFPPGWELELISVDTAINDARAEVDPT